VGEVMATSPRLAKIGQLAAAVVHEMEEYGIMALPVVDADGLLHGVIHLHDILRSGVA
jgi:arabinose-5-phosphate isomerase